MKMKINFYTRLIIILNEPTNKYPGQDKYWEGQSQLKNTPLPTKNRNWNERMFHQHLLASQISKKRRYYQETQQIKQQTQKEYRRTQPSH